MSRSAAKNLLDRQDLVYTWSSSKSKRRFRAIPWTYRRQMARAPTSLKAETLTIPKPKSLNSKWACQNRRKINSKAAKVTKGLRRTKRYALDFRLPMTTGLQLALLFPTPKLDPFSSLRDLRVATHKFKRSWLLAILRTCQPPTTKTNGQQVQSKGASMEPSNFRWTALEVSHGTPTIRLTPRMTFPCSRD